MRYFKINLYESQVYEKSNLPSSSFLKIRILTTSTTKELKKCEEKGVMITQTQFNVVSGCH